MIVRLFFLTAFFLFSATAQADLKSLNAIECYGDSNCTSDADLIARARKYTALEQGCSNYPNGAPYSDGCVISMEAEDWQRTIIVNRPCYKNIYLWTEFSRVNPDGEIVWFLSKYNTKRLRIICSVPTCGRGP